MAVEGDIGSRVQRRLGWLFKHAQALTEQANDAALAGLGIDSRDLGVLIVIDSFAPASQQQIALRMNIDRTTMVARLDQLEASGIVARRPDAEDRRRNLVVLTDHGREVIRTATAASDEAEAQILAPLSAAEADQLRELLGRVVNAPR